MGTEIERKFLVRSPGWREGVRRSRRIRQGYVVAEATRSVRVRIADDRATLTLKGPARGAVRDEWEVAIPRDDAEEILERLCDGRRLEKTRHEVEVDGLVFEIDEFHGENRGLVVAEVELEREDQALPTPDWLGPEVTDQPRYLNARLVERPFSRWTESERSPAAASSPAL